MEQYFILLIFVPMFAILIASIYTTARQWAARRVCYKRASLRSLVRGAKRNALVRYMGRA